MAKPIDEEAHFRIDELERKLTTMPTTEGIAGVAAGAAAVTLAQIKAELETIKTRQEADIALDREVIQSNLDVQRSNVELCAALKELCEHLCKPTTREISAQLPSGRVTMTVNETRN
jgi:hypothetical protein